MKFKVGDRVYFIQEYGISYPVTRIEAGKMFLYFNGREFDYPIGNDYIKHANKLTCLFYSV